jgi:glycosyltransferase involved in cell wall biosynthesis
MKLSVIISTYNSEEWLKKVLVGYSVQTEQDFELVIADDGSNGKTFEVIDMFKFHFKHPIIHVWQQDNGFQKCKILNKAIVKTNSDYLLFTDGDCIPREDFVAQHIKYKQKGFFLSGGYFKLPIDISNKISEENIRSQDCFSIQWLINNGVSKSFKLSKLIKIRFFAPFMNWLTPTKPTFNGHNTSCFKDDLININGFNEEMQYGGLDREVGERLFNNDIFSKQIRYSAVCLHLDHNRGYSSSESWKKNNEIRKYNRKNKITQIKNGINKYD